MKTINIRFTRIHRLLYFVTRDILENYFLSETRDAVSAALLQLRHIFGGPD